MKGNEPHLRTELLRRFRDSRGVTTRSSVDKPRTAGELLKAAEQCSEARQKKDAERMAREQAQRAREEAEARDRLHEEHAKKPSFIARLKKAGLTETRL